MGRMMFVPDRKESWTHCGTKELVCRMIETGPGYLLASAEEGGRWSTYRIGTSDCKVVPECAYPSGETVEDINRYIVRHGRKPHMIFDVGLIRDGQIVVAIEVSKTHWLDEKKIAKIKRTNVLVVEISSVQRDWYVDEKRLECKNIFIPDKLLADFRRLRVGESA